MVATSRWDTAVTHRWDSVVIQRWDMEAFLLQLLVLNLTGENPLNRHKLTFSNL